MPRRVGVVQFKIVTGLLQASIRNAEAALWKLNDNDDSRVSTDIRQVLVLLQRAKITVAVNGLGPCQLCGHPIPIKALRNRSETKFCSNACRSKNYRRNLEKKRAGA
jgi:RNA polymerase-binding transcription factor DksA